MLRGDGESIRGVARSVGASRNAVRRALQPGASDFYYRRSLSEDAEPAVRDVMADYPHMSVSDVAVLIDWRHSRRALSDLVARLRHEYIYDTPDVNARPMTTLTAGELHVSDLTFGTMTLGEVIL